MSNTLKLQVLLEAVDRATRPFNAVRKETEKLSADIQETQDRLDELNAKSAQIEGFRETRKELTLTQQNLKNTGQKQRHLPFNLKTPKTLPRNKPRRWISCVSRLTRCSKKTFNCVSQYRISASP